MTGLAQVVVSNRSTNRFSSFCGVVSLTFSTQGNECSLYKTVTENWTLKVKQRPPGDNMCLSLDVTEAPLEHIETLKHLNV